MFVEESEIVHGKEEITITTSCRLISGIRDKMDFSASSGLRKVDKHYLSSIKDSLLSRNVAQQVTAVKSITALLQMAMQKNQTHIADILVDADIAEFLSEAAATQHGYLLECIFTCLELLIGGEKFFTQNHTMYVADSLLRAINFLLLQEDISLLLNKALRIFAIILEKSANKKYGKLNAGGNIRPEAVESTASSEWCTIPVMEMLTAIFKKKHINEQQTVLATACVFYSLLLHVRKKWPEKLSYLIKIIFGSLSEIVLLNKVCDVSNKAVELMSSIGTIVIKLINLTSDVEDATSSSLTSSRKLWIDKDCSMKIVLNHAISTCSSYIMEKEILVHHLEIPHCVLSCIAALCDYSSENEVEISEKLVINGYIFYLPMVSIVAKKRERNSLIKLCRNVLSSLLASFSITTLEITKTWPGGFNAFKSHIREGLQNLPVGTKHWYNLLVKRELPYYMKNTIIIFFYFTILTSPEDIEMDLSSLVEFILMTTENMYLSIPVIKSLFLVFAVAKLSSQCAIQKEYLNKADKMLLSIINKYAKLSEIYTHHPALLYWTFATDQMPFMFQCEMLRLWLENEENDSGDLLMHLILNNHEASFCLLEVIQQAKNIILKRGIEVFSKSLIYEQKRGDDKLIGLIWTVLPRVLAKFTIEMNSLCDLNVSALMHLACTTTPFQPDITDVMRSAGFLCNILSGKIMTSPEFDKAAIQLSLNLLLASVKSKNMRVTTAYIHQENFLRRLHQACESGDPIICSSGIRVLSNLLSLQGRSHSSDIVQCSNGVTVEGKRLLFLLKHDNLDIITAAVELTQTIMKSKITMPVVKIGLDGGYAKANRFVLLLFGMVQNICCKRMSNVQESCWRCLGAIMWYAFRRHGDDRLLPLLATQPWTHTLVRVALASGSTRIPPGFLYFVCCWLLHFQRPDGATRPAQNRRICPDLFSITVCRIANALLKHQQNAGKEQKATLVAMHRILQSKAEIPPTLETALRKRLQQNSFPINYDEKDERLIMQ